MPIFEDIVRILADDERRKLSDAAIVWSARARKAVLLVGDRETSEQLRAESGPTVVICTPREALTVFEKTLEERPILIDPSCVHAGLSEIQATLRDALRQRDVARENARIYRELSEVTDE